MLIEFIKEFKDAITDKVHSVGSRQKFSDTRAARLISRGLAVEVTKKKKAPPVVETVELKPKAEQSVLTPIREDK